MPIVGQFGSLAGLGSFLLPGGAMESIATVTVGSGGAAEIDFTGIEANWQHLQVRGILRTSQSAYYSSANIRLNGDTGNNYAQHNLIGQGSAAYANGGASAPFISYNYASANTALSSNFAAIVIDILDYANTSKYKTMRAFNGFDNNGNGTSFNGGLVQVTSSLWMSSSAVSSIKFYLSSGTYSQYSTLALYGLRAP